VQCRLSVLTTTINVVSFTSISVHGQQCGDLEIYCFMQASSLVKRLLTEPCFHGFRATSLTYVSFRRGNLLADTPIQLGHNTGEFIFMPNPAKACDSESNVWPWSCYR
jgi:hypothetical protein